MQGNSFTLPLDKLAPSIILQEASIFFKKRAVIEEEYGKTLQKLARSTAEVYSMNDGKAGLVSLLFSVDIRLSYYSRTFVTVWQNSMKLHEALGENRIRFSQRLNEMSEELANIAKEVDKNRKSVRLINLMPFKMLNNTTA